MPQKKHLSLSQGVEAACILFSLNTEHNQVKQFTANIKETGLNVKDMNFLYREWYGFVHAAIVAGLMVHAPNSVLVEYLRCTTKLLKTHGIDKKEAKLFVDTHFAPYMEMLGKDEKQNCPKHFFKATVGADNLQDVPPRALALVSATMAMLLSAIADKLEQYDISHE